LLTGKNKIGFNLSSKGTKTFQTFDPTRNSKNPTLFFEANEEEIELAVQLADSAFTLFQQIPFNQKASFLEEIANQMIVIKEELFEMYHLESGLSLVRAESEFKRTIKQLHAFADLVKSNTWLEPSIDLPDTTVEPNTPDLRKMNIGLGPVVVFGASNFPFAYSTAGGDTASALAAGCPVIVKSHPLHAGTGELVSNAISEAAKRTGMPEGIFSNLNSSGFELAKKLVLHPKIKAVGFTGSLMGGRALFDLAASREEPIPVFAEMGSVNPVFILSLTDEMEMNSWVRKIASSVLSSAGQFCTKPGLIFLLKQELSDRFISEFTDEIKNHDSYVMLNPSMHDKFEGHKKDLFETGKGSISGKNEDLGPNVGRQAIMKISSVDFLNNELFQQEVFGPFSIIVECENISEIKKCITSIKGQLTGSLIGTKEDILNNKDLIFQLSQKVGRVIFNGVPTGVTVCPSMNHGGPYPASSDSRFTAVGIDSIKRFVRPVVYQNFPDELLPYALQDINHLAIFRRINGILTIKDQSVKKS